ncbi:MAG: tryptophan-rich sensory protein [Saprospiraceae bacterium]|nr:tryptophan-rich sensory protein [Saprospiraceae bacterium]
MVNRLLWPKIAISVVTCLLIGFLGSLSTFEALSSWYPALVKPAFNPPSWIFSPVWTTLYIMMGLAAALVWHEGWQKRVVRNALMLFLAQLLCNGLWSVVFFGMQSPGGAVFVIIILLLLIIFTIIRFFQLRKLAGYLMLPYILWVSFATVLNISIYLLNRSSELQ